MSSNFDFVDVLSLKGSLLHESLRVSVVLFVFIPIISLNFGDRGC